MRIFVFLLVAPVACISACRTYERDPWRQPAYGAPSYVMPGQPSVAGQPVPAFPQGSAPPSFPQGAPPSFPQNGAPSFQQTPPPSFQQGMPPQSYTPYPPPQPGMQVPQQQTQQVEYRWRAPDVKLYPPQISAEGKSEPAPRTTTEPPLLDKTPKSSLPVGIPQFTSVNARISAGLKPSAEDGFEWLRGAGYRAVFHIRTPGEDNATDRAEVEKRGMTFLELEVSPQTLSKDSADAFNRFLRDSSTQPIFVYDRDGSIAGSLWYLHFRTADLLSDDAARLRARGLGLREDDANQRLMWLAVQRVLSELPK